MTSHDKDLVLDLANESERFSDVQEKFFTPQLQNYELSPWNGDFKKFSVAKPYLERRTRYPIRTKSNEPTGELPLSPVRQQSIIYKPKVQVKEKKLPAIVPRVLIPRFHSIQAPPQRNSFDSTYFGHLGEASPVETTPKTPHCETPMRNMRRIIFPIDLIKKQDQLLDLPAKPISKTLELSLEIIKNHLRPKNPH